MSHTLTRRAVLATAAASMALPAFAAQPPVFSAGDGAINGYDPVAYFTQNQPVKGNAAHKSVHDGATFLFASAENKAAFDANPAKYAPQYGGYCAWAVSKGYTAKTDPDAWSIHNGMLYLNYNKAVRARWAVGKDKNIANADANWPKVLNN
jgi:YHS domain-containing protein